MYVTRKLARHCRNVTIQAAHSGGKREQVDWIGKANDNDWRNSALLGAGRRSTPRGSCRDPKEGNGEVTAGVETSQQSSDESQAEKKAHPHHTDPVLRPNK